MKADPSLCRHSHFPVSRYPVFLMFALALGGMASADDVQYAAGFLPEKSEFTLSEPIYLTFSLTNAGSNSVGMQVAGNQWGVTGPYRIEVFEAGGAKVPDEYGEGRFVVSTVIGMTEVKAGSFYVDRLYLPTFIKFTQPGEYTVVARRQLSLNNLDGPNELRRSGSLHSGDGLNWVDEYTTGTANGGSIRNFASPRSSIGITNRFKLTVLPADKERLLKRAQEMLDKLDGIGARDVVAKTDGLRVFNKMDWETEKSAWYVGADNVDLAWAVRVLSDIGDRRIIPDLERHLKDTSMKVRFACVKVLCALGEPLRAEWIVPIIKSRQWGLSDDPEHFVVKYGGTNAESILIQCMDADPAFDGAFPGVWNNRIGNLINSIGTQGSYRR
jgi:hypothetical protein